MNEEKKLNEKELENVSGGAAGAEGFEAAWAAYTAEHCGRCYHRGRDHKEYYTGEVVDLLCEGGKASASEDWAAGMPIRCPGFREPC